MEEIIEENRNESKRMRHHKKTAKDRIRTVICTIVSFLLSLAFVGLTVLCVIQWSCFSRNSFYKNMSYNHYYENVQKDITANAEALTIPIGLSLAVLEESIPDNAVYKDVNGYIDASFEGRTYVPNTTEMETRLEQNVRDYLTTEGITPTVEQEANLEGYITSVTKIYTDAVKMPLISVFMQARTIYNKIFPIGIAACGIFILVCLFLIIRMHHWFHRALRYVAYSTLATMLMTAIVPLVLLDSGFYKKIHLAPEYFYNFAMSYISNIFETFLYLSVTWAIISGIIMVFIQIIKRSRVYYKKSRKK